MVSCRFSLQPIQWTMDFGVVTCRDPRSRGFGADCILIADHEKSLGSIRLTMPYPTHLHRNMINMLVVVHIYVAFTVPRGEFSLSRILDLWSQGWCLGHLLAFAKWGAEELKLNDLGDESVGFGWTNVEDTRLTKLDWVCSTVYKSGCKSCISDTKSLSQNPLNQNDQNHRRGPSE